ncbi:MAG: radical SAM protein [Ruminococcus sp.]|nr:radical SAM protein [Ruminococcus sp.]
MYVEELNTNGYFITQKILDEIKATGFKPLIKISFDGIGCHDWIRNFKGAEKKTIDAIELCIKNGFCIVAQTQVNKKNLNTLIPTAKKLSELGVLTMRLIRTTEAPRWEKMLLKAVLILKNII